MSRNEKLKEEIGWLKVVFALLVATDISLIAWLAQNYGKADAVLMIVGTVAAIFIAGSIVWVNRIAYKRIDELEEL